MALLLLLVTLASCAATPQDLARKMFTFPEATNTGHVKLLTTKQDLSAVTVCLRSFTDLRRGHPVFSLATSLASNDFLIFKLDASDLFDLWARDKKAEFALQGYKLNTWNAICSTWDATSGLIQLWVNGKPSSRKFVSSGSNIIGPMSIVLGQEQDSYGGGFDINQSFIGMISDVHMWDYTMSSCEIQNYSDELSFTLGNVLNWNALDFQITGRVLIEDKQRIC
ncbi:serum amyloid P-component-like [Oreochromis aureus]|uniref:serum amyloid P-component-like n=1 Tax=Oreochromis aureus TaxID=47969 RepID=UPI0012BBFFFB|nr:serum amyloid P-component-like [Oreochromis aureus]XP_039475102.1 serum amyloid P-component-like [Oreochromis aureus]